jgi:hypothetical protein
MLRFLGAFAAVALLAGLVASPAPASAGIVVTVDKTAQHLSVSVDGVPRYSWPVSTARIGYRTPVGTYRPERLERTYFSRKYDWSPMPHSIFFHGGYAIHGSTEVSRLGSPASHGCIRLAPANAAMLFALVKANTNDTRIVITGGDGPQNIPQGMVSRRSRTRYSNAEDYDTRTTGRVTYESYEAPRTRNYETRNYDTRTYETRSYGRRSGSFEEIFEEPRRR